jgi:2-dehydro-3-deoxygalactonokinase
VIDGGRIQRFSTYMTGELFAAISAHTILSKSTYVGSSLENEDRFAAAIHQALASPQSIISLLFSIRARELLGVGPKGSATASISGLLIGTEIAAARAASGVASAEIALVGSGDLGARYKQAFEIANLRFHYVDAEKAVLDGLIAAARHYFANGA